MEANAEVRVVIGSQPELRGRLEQESAPETCASIAAQFPFRSRVVHARWSGECVWAPLGDLELGVGPENAKTYPSPGQVLFYPGGLSETEILIPYGGASFASIAGPLAGNHFLTITEGLETLPDVGRVTLYLGAQDLLIDWVGS